MPHSAWSASAVTERRALEVKLRGLQDWIQLAHLGVGPQEITPTLADGIWIYLRLDLGCPSMNTAGSAVATLAGLDRG